MRPRTRAGSDYLRRPVARQASDFVKQPPLVRAGGGPNVAAPTGSPSGSGRRFIKQRLQRRVLERLCGVRIVEHLLKRLHQLLRLRDFLYRHVRNDFDVGERLRLQAAQGILDLSMAKFTQPFRDFTAMLQP